MSPFDEDPSDSRSEIDLCIEEIRRLEAEVTELKKIVKDRTKDEIRTLIEKYGDPQFKTSEFALYDVISVACQLYAEIKQLKGV